MFSKGYFGLAKSHSVAKNSVIAIEISPNSACPRRYAGPLNRKARLKLRASQEVRMPTIQIKRRSFLKCNQNDGPAHARGLRKIPNNRQEFRMAATADKGLSRASHLPPVSSDSFLGCARRRNKATPRFQSVAGSAGVPAQRPPAGTFAITPARPPRIAPAPIVT